MIFRGEVCAPKRAFELWQKVTKAMRISRKWNRLDGIKLCSWWGWRRLGCVRECRSRIARQPSASCDPTDAPGHLLYSKTDSNLDSARNENFNSKSFVLTFRKAFLLSNVTGPKECDVIVEWLASFSPSQREPRSQCIDWDLSQLQLNLKVSNHDIKLTQITQKMLCEGASKSDYVCQPECALFCCLLKKRFN